MKNKKSLYDWCIENNFMDPIERWDYELNNESPINVKWNEHKEFYFKCENGKHSSEKHWLYSVTDKKSVPKCSICNSFGAWCENHARLDLLKRWDYEKNDISPYEVCYSSRKSYWFKCPKGLHPSEEKCLSNVVKQFGSSRCNMCLSLAQWGIDNIGSDFLEKYWSDKNTCDPWKVFHATHKKVWFKCQEKDYHPDYEMSVYCFTTENQRCPYCSGYKVVKEDSVGYLHPECLELWVEKKNSPYNYTEYSNKIVYWNCKKHGQYRRSIAKQVRCDFVCPKCRKEMKESKLQNKVRNYIESLYFNVRHERDCTIFPQNPQNSYGLPFDNEIVDLKLII